KSLRGNELFFGRFTPTQFFIPEVPYLRVNFGSFRGELAICANSPPGFYAEHGANQHGAAIACRRKSVDSAFFEHLKTYRNAGTGFIDNRLGRVLGHADHLGGVVKFEMTGVEIIFVQQLYSYVFIADKYQLLTCR